MAEIRDPSASQTAVAQLAGEVVPVGEACARAAEMRLERVGEPPPEQMVRFACAIAAAQHLEVPRLTRPAVVVCGADHDWSDREIESGARARRPAGLALADGAAGDPRFATLAAMRLVAAGRAAVNATARTAGAEVVIVDCGVRGAGEEADAIGPGVIDLRIGPRLGGGVDGADGVAMTREQAARAVESGAALALALAGAGVDIIALGHVAADGLAVSEAVVAALSPRPDAAPGEAAAPAGSAPDPLAALAACGGRDIGVLAGLIVGAAAVHVPVVLDEHGTSSAALVAVGLAPPCRGYAIASHVGATPVHRTALARLGATPIFDVGLAHGDGSGAALALQWLDGAVRRIPR